MIQFQKQGIILFLQRLLFLRIGREGEASGRCNSYLSVYLETHSGGLCTREICYNVRMSVLWKALWVLNSTCRNWEQGTGKSTVPYRITSHHKAVKLPN
jgi:hypothetical protein